MELNEGRSRAGRAGRDSLAGLAGLASLAGRAGLALASEAFFNNSYSFKGCNEGLVQRVK